MDKLMTHLFLLKGAIFVGTDVLVDGVVAVGAVGSVSVVFVEVALLERLFSCTFVLLV